MSTRTYCFGCNVFIVGEDKTTLDRVNPVELMVRRLDMESRHSDAAYCDSLLKACEFIIKHSTAVLLAAVPETEETKALKYRYVYRLLRADGLGEWSRVLSELLVGPTLALLNGRLSKTSQGEAFTRLVKKLDPQDAHDEWALEAVKAIRAAIEFLGEEHSATNSRSRTARFLEFSSQFPLLRNKMDAHGAPTASQKGKMASILKGGVEAVLDGAPTLQIPLVYLESPLATSSTKIRVLNVVGEVANKVDQKVNEKTDRPYEDGLYLALEIGGEIELEKIDLIRLTDDVRECYYANGAFNESKMQCEFLEYGSAKRKKINVERWSAAPTQPPTSLTAGKRSLTWDGSGTIHNLPERETGYVRRPSLETELKEQLLSRNRHVLTLRGMGGVGKTSLALEAAWQLVESRSFDLIIWASARDLDLSDRTSRLVKPEVTTIEDLAQLNQKLFAQLGDIGDQPSIEWFKDSLASDSNGSVLWILDNFETMNDPSGVFSQIDRCLGLSNRVLITTRHREYQGDYQIQVAGMEEDEFSKLVNERSIRNGVQLSPKRISQLHHECEGHPYIAIIYVAELRFNPNANVSKTMSREQVLSDLLDRTYTRLTEDSRRVFMLLCSFKSVVSQLAVQLAASFGQSVREDVVDSLQALSDNSLIKLREASDGEKYIEVPPTARVFGHQKYVSSDEQLLIKEMSEILQLFGVTTREQVNAAEHSPGLTRRIESFWLQVVSQSDLGRKAKYLELVKIAAKTHPILWKKLAEFYKNSGELRSSISAWRSLIESGHDDSDTWRKLALLYSDIGEIYNMHHARVQGLVRFPDLEMDKVVKIATQINSYVRDNWELRPLERYGLVQPLVDVMEKRINELSANALGALAPLHKKLRQDARAMEVARMGLRLDPDDVYCRRFLNLS